MKRIVNHYFKDNGNHPAFMSGLPVPTDIDGICRNIEFVACNFHPMCGRIKGFENCQFVDCAGDEYLVKVEPSVVVFGGDVWPL